MTVKELIDKLKTLDEDKEILVETVIDAEIQDILECKDKCYIII